MIADVLAVAADATVESLDGNLLLWLSDDLSAVFTGRTYDVEFAAPGINPGSNPVSRSKPACERPSTVTMPMPW